MVTGRWPAISISCVCVHTEERDWVPCPVRACPTKMVAPGLTTLVAMLSTCAQHKLLVVLQLVHSASRPPAARVRLLHHGRHLRVRRRHVLISAAGRQLLLRLALLKFLRAMCSQLCRRCRNLRRKARTRARTLAMTVGRVSPLVLVISSLSSSRCSSLRRLPSKMIFGSNSNYCRPCHSRSTRRAPFRSR